MPTKCNAPTTDDVEDEGYTESMKMKIQEAVKQNQNAMRALRAILSH